MDSELSPAERVIVEEHLGHCGACQGYLREQQKVSAALYEYFRDRRLSHSLRTNVLCHLPEMDTTSVELEEVNWRVKHPRRRWALYNRWIPAVAVVLLLVVGAIIHQNWPETGPAEGAFGVVAQASGATIVHEGTGVRSAAARPGGFLLPGQSYSTGAESSLMLAIRYGTVAKINADSRLNVAGPRQVQLERGEAWFDVGRNSQLYQVFTPDGKVTVFGTAFDVRLEPDATVVTVQRGEVQVENVDGFRRVVRGQRIRFGSTGQPGNPENVDADRICAWTNGLVADEGARSLYARHFGADGSNSTPIPALPVFMMLLAGKDLPQGGVIEVTWEPGTPGLDYCNYTVYIADERGNSLLKHRIDGSVFETSRDLPYVIPVQGGLIQGVTALNVWIVPDYSTGTVEPRGLSVPSFMPAATP